MSKKRPASNSLKLTDFDKFWHPG